MKLRAQKFNRLTIANETERNSVNETKVAFPDRYQIRW